VGGRALGKEEIKELRAILDKAEKEEK